MGGKAKTNISQLITPFMNSLLVVHVPAEGFPERVQELPPELSDEGRPQGAAPYRRIGVDVLCESSHQILNRLRTFGHAFSFFIKRGINPASTSIDFRI
jgi:hypothetical protein